MTKRKADKGITIERIGKTAIIIDDREGDVLVEELEKNGFECGIKRLKSADYVYKEIGFERKTIDDFCASIIDGRLDTQVDDMKKMYKHNFILISGRIGDRKSKINDNCIIGKIVSLIVKHNVMVIFVDNEKQMAYAIKKIVERYEGDKNAKRDWRDW